MPKATTPVSTARQARRHNPLEVDVTASGPLKSKPEKRKSRHQDEGDQFVDSKASRKILRIGQQLADEDEEQSNVQKPNPAFDFDSRIEIEEEEYEEFEEWGTEEPDVEETELSPADRAMFRKFFPREEDQLLKTGWGGEADAAEEEGPGTNLADLILEKIAAHEAAQAANGGRPQGAPEPIDEDLEEIPEKVVEVYTKYAVPSIDIDQTLILIQSRPVVVEIQIRKTTKSFQNSSDSSSLGGYNTNHTT
jgi:essential nuclear protein 1